MVSGKGGVGKTTVASALGMVIASREIPCCCLDADMGLRNLDMLLSMQNRVVYDALDVARKDCKLKYALINHEEYGSLSLLPASQMGSPRELSIDDMNRIVKKLKKRANYVLLDAPAGIGRGVSNLLPATDNVLLVTTADDIAIRDAERVIGLMEEAGKPRPMLVVNRVVPEMVTAGEMYDPQTVAETLDVPLLGYIPEDRAVLAAINRHDSFMKQDCPAKQAVERIAQRFLGEYVAMPPFSEPKRSLWSRLFKRRGEAVQA